MSSNEGSRIIPPHGGYRELKSYQAAEIAYDGTVAFCDRFIDRRSRTHDQMVQAARSGKQNIAEGSVASSFAKAASPSGSTALAPQHAEAAIMMREETGEQANTPWLGSRIMATGCSVWSIVRTWNRGGS